MPRKLILRNFLSPGDLVMLTAAVRDLHALHPGQFLTDVRSPCPELWRHNPHVTPLREQDPGVESLTCGYPLIHQSNRAPYHCIHGFADFLTRRLGVEVRPTRFHGDIHLSAAERRGPSLVQEIAGRDLPFWIINAGGKFDFTIKWWDWRRYQQVVDHFRDRILFVQIGEIGHYHPSLRGVLDLRGRLDLRQLVLLTHHAQGVLCGVTALMHLAAAVPVRLDRPRARAAVVVAGGREPTHWEAYPHHQFIQNVGALTCCQTGGCWRSRTRALGDGEPADAPGQLCAQVRNDLPRCMDLITAEEVVRRVELFFAGGANEYLAASARRVVRRVLGERMAGPSFDTTLNLATFRAALDQAARAAAAEKIPAMRGRGIILLIHTAEEIAPALAGLRALRRRGVGLPVECWHGGLDMKRVLRAWAALGATLRNAAESVAAPQTPAELQSHALHHTGWREVLVLDPDTLADQRVEKLFTSLADADGGALLFRRRKNRARPGVWKLCGLEFPAFTAAARPAVFDRARCWPALRLGRWILEHYYFFKNYVDGEGGAVQLAFARAGRPVTLRSRPARPGP